MGKRDVTAGATAIANIDGTLNTDRAINVGGDSTNSTDLLASGTINVGATGIVTIGNGDQVSNWNIGRDGLGVATVNGGSVTVTDGDLQMGNSTSVTGQANRLDITGGGTVTLSSGQLHAGATAGNEGTINVTNGTLNVSDDVFLGGNGTADADAGSTGRMTIGANGIVNVNNGASAINQNFEVGRDASGILDIDGGTLNLHTGNFVVGQTNTGSNDARGTVTFQNGATVNIGDTFVDGANTDGQNNDFNINAGGGDITHSGAGTTVRVQRDLNMQFSNAVAAVNNTSSYTISDTSTLEIGQDLNSRNNVGGSNTFTIIGGGTDVNIGRDLDFNQASSILVFDFNGTSDSINDFNFDVGRNAEVNNATLTLIDTANDLATFNGDILLIDVIGNSNAGEFVNAAQGTVFGGYRITYNYNSLAGVDGTGESIALIQAAVPEPGSLAFVGVCTAGFILRRRRKKAKRGATDSESAAAA